MDDQDTGQTEEVVSTDTSEKEVAEETKTESSDTEQSSEVKEEKEDRTFEDSFGNKLTADQLYETYNKIIPNYTRLSQELAELKKAQTASSEQTEDSIRKNELLKNVPPDVKEAIVSIVKPLIDEENTRRTQEQEQADKDKAFMSEMSSLEKKFPGGDGRPKFDRDKVLSAMREPGNRVFDPEAMYNKLYNKEVTDYLIKQALKQQSGGRKSEATGVTESSKPEGKSPKSFAEAAQAMLSRIQSNE